MALIRSQTCLKSIMGRFGGGGGSSFTFATSTGPKMKAYAPTADSVHQSHPDTKPRPVKGDFVPVCVALGMIFLSGGFGLYTMMHQLSRSPNVQVKKSRRESLPELEDPEIVLNDADRFIKKSFFRKVAHVQDPDRQDSVPDPIRGDAFAVKPRADTLKSIGVDPKSKSVVE